MTRWAVGFDRLVTAVLGAALMALGVAGVAWERGTLGGGGSVRIVVLDVLDASWWPWASGGAGLALALVGLRWLVAHRRAPKASRVWLRGSGPALSADASAAARAAGVVLASQAPVLKAGGRAVVERGAPTVTLTATVPARHGLAAGVAVIDDTAKTLALVLGDAVAVRSVLHTDGKAGPVLN